MLSPLEKVIVAGVVTVIDAAIFVLSPALGLMAVLITAPLTAAMITR